MTIHVYRAVHTIWMGDHPCVRSVVFSFDPSPASDDILPSGHRSEHSCEPIALDVPVGSTMAVICGCRVLMTYLAPKMGLDAGSLYYMATKGDGPIKFRSDAG